MSQKYDDSSVGEKIVSSLKNFVETIEATDDVDDVLRRFNCRTIKLNLEAKTYSPELVKNTRELLGASQSIFAQFLGVSASAVQDWEQGAKPPRGSACRLMDEIRCNPGYWIDRLRELSTPVNA